MHTIFWRSRLALMLGVAGTVLTAGAMSLAPGSQALGSQAPGSPAIGSLALAQTSTPLTSGPKAATAPVARGEFTVLIEGSKQGVFKGESTRESAKDRMVGRTFAYELTAQMGGKRTHGPVVLTKSWGAASPQIFQAATTGEVLKRVELEFYQAGPSGAVELQYTIKLTGATIVGVKQYTLNNEFLEDVSIAFQKIDVEHKPSKTAASDSVR